MYRSNNNYLRDHRFINPTRDHENNNHLWDQKSLTHYVSYNQKIILGSSQRQLEQIITNNLLMNNINSV